MSLQIVVPVFNTEMYLDKCFASLLQGHHLFEEYKISVLFIDDGSTDDSLGKIKYYKKKYNFVDYISQSNQGSSVARNNAIRQMKADYFVFLDSDDCIDILKLIKLYHNAVSDRLDVLAYQLEYYNEKGLKTGEKIAQTVPLDKIMNGKDVLLSGYQPSSACLFLYRTEFIKSYNLLFFQGITQQDVEFTVRLFLRAERVLFSDEIVYKYFRRSGSITIPKLKEKLEKYLKDSIIVAQQIRYNLETVTDEQLRTIIEENYNNVVWNLLWRFWFKKDEVDKTFKLLCLNLLEEEQLYPIKGKLKTNFQKLSLLIINWSWVFKRIV